MNFLEFESEKLRIEELSKHNNEELKHHQIQSEKIRWIYQSAYNYFYLLAEKPS